MYILGPSDREALATEIMTEIMPIKTRHCILSREWRVIVDLVQTNYHGMPMVLKSVGCNRAVDHEGSSLCTDVFKSVKTLEVQHYENS